MLTDTTCKNAKAKDKPYKLADEKGMFLLVNPNGSKYFRLKYRISGKEKLLALGVYPETGLKQARDKRDKARSQLADGVDPSGIRKADKITQTYTFERMAREWFASNSHTLTSLTHHKKLRRFEIHVFPILGNIGVNAVKSPDVFNLIKPLIAKGELETAHRIRSEISGAFAYAIAHGLTDYDPAQAVAKQLPAQKVKHRPALIEPNQVAQLLRDITHYQGTFVVQCALRLSPLLFQRPGEIRQMEWKDIDLVACEWRYLVTKTEFNHIVPLSTQAVKILESIKPLTGSGRYVFPSSRGDGRSMSDNTIRTALRTLGYDGEVMTAHGFRTTASTLLNEQGWSPDAIERQLAHAPRDAVRAAYNRAQYLEELRKMMQSWADYLDTLKATQQS
jgi:integrase